MASQHPSVAQQIDAATGKRRRKKAAPTITQIVNEPPLILSAQQKDEAQAGSLRVLQVRFPMLPSINRQYKVTSTAGRHLYTDPDYQEQKDVAREILEAQVRETGWTTSKDDLYIVVFDFPYVNETEQDLDGPIKATTDVLQRQLPSKAERRDLVTPALLEAWKEAHPYAIWNDGNIMQSLLFKHINQGDLTCQVTIYAFASQQFPVIPMHLFLFRLLSRYLPKQQRKAPAP